MFVFKNAKVHVVVGFLFVFLFLRDFEVENRLYRDSGENVDIAGIC